MIARSLPEADWDENVIPVIYLPGVSRAVFRDVEKATDVLKPLMELPYRGTFWTQKNHKDWTLIAFLQSEDGGLGLDIKNDEATRDAIKTSLAKLADLQWTIGTANDWRQRTSPISLPQISIEWFLNG